MSLYPGQLDPPLLKDISTHSDADTRIRAVQSALGVNPQGTASTVAARLAGLPAVVTPQQYGAVADGVADATSAINAAFASQQPVHFPAGNYKISGTVRCNRNGRITTAGKVRLVVTAGAVLDSIREADGTTASGKTVVFDHQLLDRGVVDPITIVGNGAAGTVALSSSQTTPNATEPNNTFLKPDLSGCEWAVWSTFDSLAIAGMISGNNYIDLSSSCPNGVRIGQNQDDVTFSGSTRLRNVTGVAVQKDAGVATHLGNVFIGLATGGKGIVQSGASTGVTVGSCFIEAEPSATGVQPVILTGTGINTPRTIAKLVVLGRFACNVPDGTTWVRMEGRYDKVFLVDCAGLDYNGVKPAAKLIGLVHGDLEPHWQSGTIVYDGEWDARVITRPVGAGASESQASFDILTNNGTHGIYRGSVLHDWKDRGAVAVTPLLINAAATVFSRDPLARRDQSRVVRMEGAINKTNGAEVGIVSALPVGYRPITTRTFAVPGVAGAVIEVRADGVMVVTPGTVTGTISLDGVQYQAV